jgi:charged multivesicular body protein 6
MGIFSSKSKNAKAPSRITEQDIAVLKLKQQRDELKKYQKRISGVMEKDRELARRLLAENRRERAKLLLKKKRFLEDMLQKTDNQIDQLERLVTDIEFKQIEMKVVDGLRIGNESLKQINAMMDVAEIEKILEETQEGAEKQAEINSLLSEFSSVSSVSDEDLEAELAGILDDEEMAELPEPPTEEPEPASVDLREKPVAKKTKTKREPELLPA